MSQYAQIPDLQNLGLTASALANVTTAQQNAALVAASGVADGYLADQFTLPLIAWGIDLTRYVACIAAYDLLSMVGYYPDGQNSNWRLRFDDAIRWLEGVARGKIPTAGIQDSGGGVDGGPQLSTGVQGVTAQGGPLISTGATNQRGW